MYDLKPCPCGKPANQPRWTVTHPTGYGIECSDRDCHWGFYGFEDEEEVAEAWNYRPVEDALMAEVAKLRAALEQYANEENWSFQGGSAPDLWYGYEVGPNVAKEALR